LKTAPFRLLALFWTLLAFSAEGAVSDFVRISPKERAQGYRDTTVIARPLDADDDGPLTAAEQREGMLIQQRFHRFGNMRVLRLPIGENVKQAITRLKATGRYAYVEPDSVRYGHVVPNDPSFAQQWSLNNTGQNGGTPAADIRAVSAWDLRNDASDVIVAVIDSGIRLSHSDLVDNLWTRPGTNFHGIRATDGNGTTTNNPDDDDGHGTHVAGIIGARGNSLNGISGVAWRTKLMALKFLTAENSGSTSDAITCINYAIDNGAKVINASYGSPSYSRAELEALTNARNAGIIVVASAGNDGELNDTTDSYPANYPLDNIVSVAATTRTDELASFSNYGSGLVELAAPGQDVYSTFNSSDSSYAIRTGTSMSSPHVSGALALLKASYPSDSYRQLINRLLRSTSKIASLREKVQTGGRLNLAQALASTTSNRPFNDDFADRALVSGPNVRIRSNNEGATSPIGEQLHAGVAGSTSLWWSWTAPSTSRVTFDTVGSSYDTALAVYTGTSVNGLTSIGSNDNASGVTTSRVQIDAVGGTTYQIAVTGKNNSFGYTALRIGTVPPNDDFANAQLITGESLSINATLFSSTKESGERNHTSNAAGHSIWYKWVAPKTAPFVLSAYSTAIDTIAAVYTGSSLSNLAVIGAVDDPAANPANSDALVKFDATAGTTYYFAIDHAATSGGSPGGEFILTLNDALWEFPANDEVTSSPAVGSDGTIYFGAGSGDEDDTNVYAVTSTGTKKWSFTTGESGIIGASPAVGSDGTVYIGGTDKIFYALNGASGTKKWSVTAGTAISSTAAIGADGTIYFRDDTKLYALSANGSLRWTFDLAGSTDGTYCSPAIGADGTLYVGTNGGAFYAVKDNGGSSVSQKWKFTANDDIFTSPSVAADGTIYFATLSGTVYALTDNGSSASQKWAWTVPNNNSVTSSIAIGADGSLYFAAYDRSLYALTSSGTRKWAFILGDEVRASSPAIAADGTVYVGCYDGKVYGVSSSGSLARVFTTAKTIRSSPVIAGTRLYIGSADARLYAFELNQGAAASSWPMFHSNATRTGRVGTTPVGITAQPQSRTLLVGSTLTLSVTATGSGTVTYQCATNSTFTITGVNLGDAGSYTVMVTNGTETVTSSPAVVTILPPGTMPSGFANIATRAYCSTANRVTIGGFVVSGTSSKRVLVRAVGPSLTTQGLLAPEVLADPTIDVYQGSSVIASNDDWGSNSNATEITNTSIQIGASALDSSDTKSSALLLTLPPGVYSFVVNGKSATSGVVLLEVYDADGGVGSKFVNIATRAYATTGSGVAIGGFVISGNVSKNILVRAVGPTLSTQGLNQSEVLADPVIELHQGTPVIAINDDWGSGGNKDEIVATGVRIGATPFALTDTASSALLLNLQPGVYSFIASGKNNSSGIVLVEIYDAD
jgi:subtilisin family serine protease